MDKIAVNIEGIAEFRLFGTSVSFAKEKDIETHHVFQFKEEETAQHFYDSILCVKCRYVEIIKAQLKHFPYYVNVEDLNRVEGIK